MTFTEIQTKIAARMGLTATTSLTRIGESINECYAQVVTSCGLTTLTNAVVAGVAVPGSRVMTFSGQKILSVYDNAAKLLTSLTAVGTLATATTLYPHGLTTGDTQIILGATPDMFNGGFTITVTGANTFTFVLGGTPGVDATGTIVTFQARTIRVIGERTLDDLRNQVVRNEPPNDYAIYRAGATATQIYLDCLPTTYFVLLADVEENQATLSGTDVPAFPAAYHNILIPGGMAIEYDKMEKPDLATKQEIKYERRLSDLRYHLASSAYKDLYQSKRRTWNIIQRLV